VKFAQSNRSITDLEVVKIEIAAIPDRLLAGLRLTYQDRTYDLIRIFGDRQLDLAQQQFQDLSLKENAAGMLANSAKYLLVREVGYYSLWALARSIPQQQIVLGRADLVERRAETSLELQQASMWLLQEIWLQWQELLGTRQLQILSENLISIAPQLQSRTDLDRLLAMSPMTPIALKDWESADLIAFDRQLYQLAQQKLGRLFATELTIEIVRSMPPQLQSALTNVLDL
jgi:hypothetical protein